MFWYPCNVQKRPIPPSAVRRWGSKCLVTPIEKVFGVFARRVVTDPCEQAFGALYGD